MQTAHPASARDPMAMRTWMRGRTPVLIGALSLVLLAHAPPASAATSRTFDSDDVRSRLDIRIGIGRTYESAQGRRKLMVGIERYSRLRFSYGSFTWFLDTRADNRIDYTVNTYFDSASSGWSGCVATDRRWPGRTKFGRLRVHSDGVRCHFPRGFFRTSSSVRYNAFTSGFHRRELEPDRAPDRRWSLPVA